MIRAIFVIGITFAYTLLVGIPILVYSAISGTTDALYSVGLAGARMALRLAGITVKATGLERIPKGRPVVFMPNHQSNIDPPAVFVLLPPVLIMVKKEFFRIPVLARGMLMRGFIAVDRRDRPRAIAAVEEAVHKLKAGHSFLVYPEGTRSPDGRLQPFKKGAFVMAIKAGAPIVPISISGSRKIMAKGKLAIHPGVVRVTLHDPVPTEGRTLDDLPEIMDQVRAAILAGVNGSRE